MNDSWAFVRQVVLATATPEADATALRDTYALPHGFTDPELLEHGIADETIPLGPRQYLELIAPASETSPLNAWLGRAGGRAGYGVAVQVPEMAVIRERAQRLGVRIMIDQLAFGHPIMQLHPRDVGILLDLDEAADKDWWFWDEISPGPSDTAVVDAVLAVEVGVTDPERMAALWSELLAVAQPTATSVDLGTTVNFVPADRGCLLAVTLQLANGEPMRDDVELVGIKFRHRPRSAAAQ